MILYVMGNKVIVIQNQAYITILRNLESTSCTLLTIIIDGNAHAVGSKFNLILQEDFLVGQPWALPALASLHHLRTTTIMS